MRNAENQLKNVVFRGDDKYMKLLKRIALEKEMALADLLRLATDKALSEELAQERERSKAV